MNPRPHAREFAVYAYRAMKGSRTLHRAEPAVALRQPSRTPPLSILVVEDDLLLLRLNTELLSRASYRVDAAADGAAAWLALNTHNYDLLITDNDMPQVSGIELLKKLYAARMDLLVIMATGALPEEEFTRFPGIRPAATILKPFTFKEMLTTVEEVLRGAYNIVAAA